LLEAGPQLRLGRGPRRERTVVAPACATAAAATSAALRMHGAETVDALPFAVIRMATWCHSPSVMLELIRRVKTSVPSGPAVRSQSCPLSHVSPGSGSSPSGQRTCRFRRRSGQAAQDCRSSLIPRRGCHARCQPPCKQSGQSVPRTLGGRLQGPSWEQQGPEWFVSGRLFPAVFLLRPEPLSSWPRLF
jgi:hypothetical protein